MKLSFRLSLSFVIIFAFAGLTMARGAGERLSIAEFASNPDSFAGRTVELQARVIAISADGQSLELFDSASHMRISVQLAQLPKTERKALICSGVREVLVRGRVAMIAGRPTIHAESVQWSNASPQK